MSSCVSAVVTVTAVSSATTTGSATSSVTSSATSRVAGVASGALRRGGHGAQALAHVGERRPRELRVLLVAQQRHFVVGLRALQHVEVIPARGAQAGPGLARGRVVVHERVAAGDAGAVEPHLAVAVRTLVQRIRVARVHAQDGGVAGERLERAAVLHRPARHRVDEGAAARGLGQLGLREQRLEHDARVLRRRPRALAVGGDELVRQAVPRLGHVGLAAAVGGVGRQVG